MSILSTVPKGAAVEGINPNLLRNWYFVGGGTGRGVFPVNSRGQTSYSGYGYVIDGWKEVGAQVSSTIYTDKIRLTYNGSSTNTWWFSQLPSKQQISETITASFLLKKSSNFNLNLRIYQADGTNVSASVPFVDNSTYVLVSRTANSWGTSNGIGLVTDSGLSNGNWIDMVAAKLELGDQQTLAHQENGVWVLNEIPDYEEEYYRCITSDADSADTYANKSMATEQQIAYVENSTTASRAYTVGEYFCWHGLLYRAKTAISSGDPFTVNTNCEQVTGGGLNNVGFIDISSYITVNQNRLNNVKIKARYYPGSKKVELQAAGTAAETLTAAQNTLLVAASPYAATSGEQQFAGCGVKNQQTPVAVWANSASINVQHGGASAGDKIAISLSWLL